MTEKVFNYVVGYPWEAEEPDHLCIYAYHSEIQRGTMKDAKAFLKYVKRNDDDEDGNEYKIYEVKFEEVK